MALVHTKAWATAKEYGFGDNLMAGAKIAGFLNVAEAMYAQGIVY